MGVKIKPKDPQKKKGEAERTKHSVPMPSYGLQNPGKDSYSPSTENKTPTGTRYNYQTDQSIAPIQYEAPTAMYKKNKSLGPMAKLHGGPGNKAIGGLNSTGPEAMSEISKNIPPKSDTIRVSRKYKPGDFVEEYELEKEIKKQTGAFPQLSVQDYSKVEVDDKGRNIVVKKGPQATDPDIKAAKKQIRKGANVLGGGNIVDDFGYKHGYQSAKTKELDNSRLVQRKKRQYVKQEAKSNIKGYRGKDNRKSWKSDEFTTDMSNLTGKEFTAKDGNKARKQEIKRIKKNSKDTRKTSKKISKANRILAKI